MRDQQIRETPELAQPGGKKPKSVLELLQEPDMRKRMLAVLPRHLSADRMVRVMAMAVHNTPKLLQCNQMSLLGALMVCATLGLEPNTPLGEVYLVPFGRRVKVEQDGKETWVERTDVQVIIGYRGFISLARRSGMLVSLQAEVVYEGDTFEFEYGTNQHLKHIPNGAHGGRKAQWAYCFAKLSDGDAFVCMPYEEVLKTRNSSAGYIQALKGKDAPENDWKRKQYEASPWVRHEHEMARKTAVRYLAKYLPMSIEFASALNLDEHGDKGVDYSHFAQNPGAITDGDIKQIEHSSEEPIETSISERAPAAATPVASTAGAPVQGGAAGAQQGPAAPAAKRGRPRKEPPPAAATQQPGAPPPQEEPPPPEDEHGGADEPAGDSKEFEFE